MRQILKAAAVAAALIAATGAMAEIRVPSSQAEITLSFAPVVKSAAPAVVNIYTRKVVERRRSPFEGDPFFERFFKDFGFSGPSRKRIENSLGSGVIVDPSGIVVSNNHVVGGADEITVVLPDRREYEAELLLADARTDLAVLHLKGAEDLPALKLRDSDTLEVGDLVLAIGNPFGVGQTVTSGIISALERPGLASRKRGGGDDTDARLFIQTDAAINPGNSGGALVDMRGRLVGVNTAILSRSGGSNGIGFAIPANLVARVVESAEAGADEVRRPWSGVVAQVVDQDLASGLGLARPTGLILKDLHPLSPFAEAGLKVGDVVTAIDGEEIASLAELSFRLESRALGETAKVAYLRRGEARVAEVALTPAPEEPPSDLRKLEGVGPLSGAVVANVNPAVIEKLDLPLNAEGVAVLSVSGRARANNLRPGDVIRAVNGAAVFSSEDLDALNADMPGPWELQIDRGDRSGTLAAKR